MEKMRVLAIFSAAYACAVFAAVYLPVEGLLLPLGGLCLAALPVLLLTRGRTGDRGKIAALAAAGAAAGFLWTAAYQAIFVAPARQMDDKTVRLTAQVLEYPRETDYGCSVLVRAETESAVKVDALLYMDAQGFALQPGDTVRAVTWCGFADRSASGEEIAYYTAKGVFLRGRTYGTVEIQRPERPPLRVLPAVLAARLRESILSAFPEETGPVILSVVTGNRDRLSESYSSALRRAGLRHTVAVSGMHLSFLAGFFTFLLGRHRRRTSLIVMPVLLLFMLVSGCTPSIVRATVMALMLLAAPLFDRERDDFTALAFALFVLLVQNPLAAAHVGLQLSFGAVAGIFLVSGDVQGWLDRKFPRKWAGRWTPGWFINGAVSFVTSTLSAAVGAMVVIIPLSALRFSTLSLVCILSNLLTLWAVGAVFCGGMAVGFVGLLCPPLARSLAVLAAPFAVYLNWIIPTLARLPFASVTMNSFYYRAWAVLLCALIFLTLLQRVRRVAFPAVLCALSLVLAIVLTNLSFRAGSMSVTALDVGQGQSVLLRQGSRLVLVDCGGDGYDSAGDAAADFIQDAGYNRLDLLVISHYHTDHANGVPQLLRRLEVGTVALPDVEEEDGLRREILSLAEEKGVEVRFIREDTEFFRDESCYLTVYAPMGAGNMNEEGLTVLAGAEGFDVLITGDMGADAERLLLAHADLPDIELLVAGHHGSANAASRELLEAVRPELALISVGKRNRYGHPARETLERLDACGAEIYRTDLQGSVTVRAAGQK